ncbi:MAG TPA: DNA mismatch repair endonuclease MutL [Melioribacteraceae bacterium]|nr:DNA mismatch repair endonuclease MutL [Melioribacteraceae bacterium]
MKINILPDYIANKIAAGEVVQRPESVLKELLENSVDAKANSIEVIIKNAGKSLIQIIDNGEGMTEEDAKLSIQRHATSKIKTYEDLEALRTFGFRGEALSSIAAVSLLEIKTRTAKEDLGTIIKVNENNNITLEKGSFPVGTSIAVKNLFFNTPARRNFLKSNATELKHIIETFKKIAISYPDISFMLFIDDELIYQLPKQLLSERLKALYGDNILDSLIEVKELTDYLSISGFIAKPTYLRKSKGEQLLFINKRFVVSKIVNHAVFTAFENILEKGDYPFFVLFLEIDPSKVDINVHPSKLEVKFDEEKDIYLFVHAVIKKSIGSYDLVPSMRFIDTSKDTETIKFNDFVRTERNDYTDRPFVKEKKEGIFSDDEIEKIFGTLKTEIKNNIGVGEVSEPFTEKKNTEYYHQQIDFGPEHSEISSPFIVSLHNKYILSQIKSGLMIIDQHVAHERILYESALNSINQQLQMSQQLLFPQSMKLDPGDYELVIEIREQLFNLGFEIKFYNDYTITISGVPFEIKPGEEKQILTELLEEYRQNQRLGNLEVVDNIAKSFSCKAAIKAGDRLSEQEMRALVDKLFATQMPYVCPHGRPIVIKIPINEFDRRFGRTS